MNNSNNITKNILLIDSDNSSREIYKTGLEEFANKKQIKINVIESENGMQSISKIKRVLPHIIIINYYLNDMTAIDVIEKSLEEFKKKFDHIYIIILILNSNDIMLLTPFVTSIADTIALKVIIMEQNDMFEKHIEEVFVKIQKKMNWFKDIYVDELTKAYNRKWLSAYMDGLVTHSSSINNSDEKNGIIIGSMDINKFKNINDTFGHEIGDMVLKNLVKYLNDYITEIIPLYFYIVRIGGDEFIFIVPINKELAETFKEEFKNFNSYIRKKGLKDLGLRLGISIGIDYCENSNSDMIIKKIKETDGLMYQNKKESRLKL